MHRDVCSRACTCVWRPGAVLRPPLRGIRGLAAAEQSRAEESRAEQSRAEQRSPGRKGGGHRGQHEQTGHQGQAHTAYRGHDGVLHGAQRVCPPSPCASRLGLLEPPRKSAEQRKTAEVEGQRRGGASSGALTIAHTQRQQQQVRHTQTQRGATGCQPNPLPLPSRSDLWPSLCVMRSLPSVRSCSGAAVDGMNRLQQVTH